MDEKSAPKGYTASHPRIDLRRMKDLYAGNAFKPSACLSARHALNRVAKAMADIKPPATGWRGTSADVTARRFS